MTAAPLDKTTSRFEPVVRLLEASVADGAFPGAVFGVLHRGRVVALGAVGRFRYDLESDPVKVETAYDLASLTKVIATTAMAMLLWQRGVLYLDRPLGELLPRFVGLPDEQGWRKKRVTPRLLLAHGSGLPAYVRLFERCRDADALMEAVFRLPVEAEPGTVAAYSDPGFILLGNALEALAGESVDRFCRREIFAPLGMEQTRFRPETAIPPAKYNPAIPPTEDDRTFRGRVVQGEVHDENCFVLGGVAGHAGLFAPAGDVLRFAEAMLSPLRGGSATSLFTAETVRLFTKRAGLPEGSSRALGWDTPSGSPSSSGTRFSGLSFGHLGYTGTSLWIDPREDAAVVLLTNRIFPTRENRKIQGIRPVFHDAVRQLLSE